MSIKSDSLIENENNEELLENEDELLTDYKDDNIYPMNNVKVEKGFFSVYELKRKYDSSEKRIILDSDFQRDNVWKKKQKAELIESILMGLPLPIFYFNEDRKGRLIVIDGRQRLNALFQFLNNEFSLGNLKILTDFSKLKFHELDPVFQSKIEDYQIQAHVIQPPTPDRIKFDIFDRVNRAGTQLNKQEIRNALYQGNSTKLLKELIKTKEFSDATSNAFEDDTRMKDKYILLRFLAFSIYLDNRFNDIHYEYKNDIDDFLGRTMEYLNNCDSEEIKNIREKTIYCLKNSAFYLGENGFRLIRNGKRSPINMNLFECLMYLMTIIPYRDVTKKNLVHNKVRNLLNNTEFLDSIGNHRDSWIKIQRRFNMVRNLAKEVEE